ncbi:MAG: hypothetical protein ACKV22_24770 [Bryobacteraceae bacterium]
MRSARNAVVDRRVPGLGFKVSLLLAVSCLALFAQPAAPAAASPIPTDSPLLFRLFFGFHLDFDNWLAARRTAAPASASSLDVGAANLLGLKAVDVSTLSSVSRSVAVNVDQIDRDQAAYLNLVLSREERPDPAVMNQYRTRREAAVAAGMAALQRNLPAGSYAGLLDFINGRFRAAHRIAGDR